MEARVENGKSHVETKVAILMDDWTVSLDTAAYSPNSAVNTSFFVYVENVDAAYARALARGAISLAAPQNKPHRERSAKVQDSVGNTWTLYTFKRRLVRRRSLAHSAQLVP
jgi:uncharacterized glyoxalase superfamily protein PhnB